MGCFFGLGLGSFAGCVFWRFFACFSVFCCFLSLVWGLLCLQVEFFFRFFLFQPVLLRCFPFFCVFSVYPHLPVPMESCWARLLGWGRLVGDYGMFLMCSLGLLGLTRQKPACTLGFNVFRRAHLERFVFSRQLERPSFCSINIA